MKRIKIISFICVILLHLSGYTQNLPSSLVAITQQENSFTITFNLPDYTLKDTMLTEDIVSEIFKCIEINDYFGIVSDSGNPQLPQLTFDLHIPEDAIDFQVSILNIDTQHLILNRRMMPFQDLLETDSFVLQINNVYYDSDGSLYNFTSQLSDSYYVMGAKGISFSIFPFTYNPMENSVSVLNTATFVITYTSQGQFSFDSSGIKRKYLSNFFENFPYDPNASYLFCGRYLMITAPEYESTLTYFANYKRNIGYTVDVANTNTTGTSATAIKNYIQARYGNIQTRPDYVLLVGDCDDIPACEGTEGNYYDPLTDVRYATLDGDDDFFPDVFLGRFSVSNISELQNIINKTIFMEMNIHRFDKKAVLLAGSGPGEKKFDNPQIWIRDNILIPKGYACDSYFAVDGAIDKDGINALSGNYTFFVYRGHGKDSTIQGPFNLIEDDINTSSNTIYPFGFGFACLTNNFGYRSVCFGESWIRSSHGGVSYFGATTITYRHVNNVIEKRIFKQMDVSPHLSPWINLGMKDYYQRFWSWLSREKRKIHMISYNLLGDPSLNIHGTNCIDNFTFAQNEVFHNGDIVTYHADYSVQNNNVFEIHPGADISLKAGNEITLRPGFHAVGGDFEAKIEPCNNNPVVMSLIPQEEEEKEENITDIKEVIIDPSQFSIFPNPTKSEFSVSYTLDKNDFVKLDIYTINGSKLKTLLNGNNQNAGNYYFNFSVSELSAGIYVLVFTSSTKKYTYKLIKN